MLGTPSANQGHASPRRYVIMANGKGTRWDNYGGIPKQLIPIDGETLLQRTTRLVRWFEDIEEVVISSSNPRCVAEGAVRHVPEHGEREIDRFCYELIGDDTCFLYGDVYYTEAVMKAIVDAPVEEGVLFFGTTSSIVALRVADGDLVKGAIDDLIALIDQGDIEDAKGWHLYHRLEGMPLQGHEVSGRFIVVPDETRDFNYPEDLAKFEAAHIV